MNHTVYELPPIEPNGQMLYPLDACASSHLEECLDHAFHLEIESEVLDQTNIWESHNENEFRLDDICKEVE